MSCDPLIHLYQYFKASVTECYVAYSKQLTTLCIFIVMCMEIHYTGTQNGMELTTGLNYCMTLDLENPMENVATVFTVGLRGLIGTTNSRLRTRTDKGNLTI